jgi:Leucine-rich repeat (LRR) protein
VWQSSLSRIPLGIGTYFPNLKGLDIAETSLMTLSKNDLQQFPYLNTLSMQYNKIVSLNGDVFSTNRQLRQLHLSSNNIQGVGSNLFRDLIYLQEVYMFANPCIDAYATTAAEIQSLNNILPQKCPF